MSARDASAPKVAPRGLSAPDAAAYIGISASLFLAMVDDRRMPKPRCINARRVWDRYELDEAFALLPHEGEPVASHTNEWDDVLA